jgi:hypothetical protein
MIEPWAPRRVIRGCAARWPVDRVLLAGGTLMKVSMTGGPPIPLCHYQGVPRGASWGPNDTIVFATAGASMGLFSVPGGGGEPKVLTTPDAKHGEVNHVSPSVLPGGQAVLFTIPTTTGLDTAQVGKPPIFCSFASSVERSCAGACASFARSFCRFSFR